MLSRRFCISLLLCIVFLGNTHGLPDTVVPKKYCVELNPWFEDTEEPLTFKGKSTMIFTVTNSEVYELILHSKLLRYTNYHLRSTDARIIESEIDPERETIKFTLDKPLKMDTVYKLDSTFTGDIQNEPKGLYKSSYKQDNETEWILTAIFESQNARLVFPCLDDLKYKARFSLSVICPKNYTCLSNMDVKKIEKNFTVFHETPVMPPYLLGLVVSKNEVLESYTKDNKRFTIWGRKFDTGNNKLAFDVGVKFLEAMDEYTKIPYYDIDKNVKRILKLDHISIGSIGSVAVIKGIEHWGLIIYAESLFHNPNQSFAHKQDVAKTVTHEISHMWFGNLVICSDWNDLWLKEAFASFYAYYITNKIDENLLMEHEFLSKQHEKAMEDAASSPLEIGFAINDSLTHKYYERGVSVIRMIQHWLGEETFQKGIRNYLHINKFKNVKPKDLYNALQTVSDEDKSFQKYNSTVEEVMGSWISNPGYPYLNVHIDKDTGSIEVTQHRYMEQWENFNNVTYIIPVSYTCQRNSDFSDTRPKFILKNEPQIVDCEEKGGWAIFNIQSTGLYRVNYDADTWDLIITTLKRNTTQIHPYNRARLIHDALELFYSRIIKKDKIFRKIFKYLSNETDYLPWSAAYATYDSYTAMIDNKNSIYMKSFKKIIIKAINSEYKRVINESSSEDLDSFSNHYKKLIFSFSCAVDHEDCVALSLDLFKSLRVNNIPIDPILRYGVYCTAFRLEVLENVRFLLSNPPIDKEDKIDFEKAFKCIDYNQWRS